MALTIAPTGIYTIQSGDRPEAVVRDYLADKGVDASQADITAMTEKLMNSKGLTYADGPKTQVGDTFDLSVLDADVAAKGGSPIKAAAAPALLAPTAPLVFLPPAGTRNGRQTGDSAIFGTNLFGSPFDPNQNTNEILARFGIPPITNAPPPGIIDISGNFQNILSLGVPDTTQWAFGFDGAQNINSIVNAISGKNALASAGRNAFDISQFQ